MACIAFVLILGFPVGMWSQKKHTQTTDLPPAVQKAAGEQSEGANVRGYSNETEDGKLEYGVELTVNVFEVEEEVALETLPANVKASLKKRQAKARSQRWNQSPSMGHCLLTRPGWSSVATVTVPEPGVFGWVKDHFLCPPHRHLPFGAAEVLQSWHAWFSPSTARKEEGPAALR